MDYNLKDPAILDKIVEIVESSENQNRIQKHTIDYQIINGNQADHIRSALQRRYPESHDQMTVIDLKIGEKIIRKQARVYAAGVKRQVVNCETNEIDEKMTDLINYIYADINPEGEDFNDIMIEANKYYMAHQYVEVFCYEDEEGYIRAKTLPQHMFTAIANNQKTLADVIVFKNTVTDFDNTKAFIDWDLLALELNNLEIVASYTVWSKTDNFTFVRVRGEKREADLKNTEVVFKNVITKNDDNPSGKNPYDIMPFAALKKSTKGHFYPYGSEIPQMSKECCLILCNLVLIATNQGFGQAVVYYEGEAPPKEFKSGPTQIIALPNNEGKSRFEFQNANADIAGMLNTDLSIIRMLLSTNDLTTDKVSGELQATNFASAIDRLIADNESIEFTESLRKKFINAEQKLFKIVLEILRYQVETQTLPEDYPQISLADITKKLKLKIQFNSIKPMTTEKDKAETIQLLEQLGLILSWEKHMKFDESLTPEEAKERERIISEERAQKQQEFMESQLPSKMEEDMMEIEDGDRSDKKIQLDGTSGQNKERTRTGQDTYGS